MPDRAPDPKMIAVLKQAVGVLRQADIPFALAGTERGLTAGGHHVRNVAQPVIGHAYRLYCLLPDGAHAEPECPAPAAVLA